MQLDFLGVILRDVSDGVDKNEAENITLEEYFWDTLSGERWTKQEEICIFFLSGLLCKQS